MLRLRGFTLVELMVVFAIMALLVGLAPVAFERLRDNANYREALRGVMVGMRTARQQALISRTEARFLIDLPRRSYRVEGQADHLVPDPLQIRVQVAGVASTDREAGIRFFPEGGATGGSVEIIRPSGAGARLRVDWLSGRVSMEDLTP